MSFYNVYTEQKRGTINQVTRTAPCVVCGLYTLWSDDDNVLCLSCVKDPEKMAAIIAQLRHALSRVSALADEWEARVSNTPITKAITELRRAAALEQQQGISHA